MSNQSSTSPLLSVIVPVLNEAEALPNLFAQLQRQEGIAIELLLVDGGSSDASTAMLPNATFPARWISSERGRGRQLNAGIREAQGEYLLLLHADSGFPDCHALASAVQELEKVRQENPLVAGHFRLRFADAPPEKRPFYSFHEQKAALDRPGCTHGDQGFCLHRSLLEQVGSFREDLPVLEDTLWADHLRELGGRWLLLPAGIETSARRFMVEGEGERRILNGLILLLGKLDRLDLLATIGPVYQEQRLTGRLSLQPLLAALHQKISAEPLFRRLGLWYRAGRYLQGEIWQVPLLRLCERGGTVRRDEVHPGWLLLERLTAHPLGYLFAALGLRIWLGRVLKARIT